MLPETLTTLPAGEAEAPAEAGAVAERARFPRWLEAVLVALVLAAHLALAMGSALWNSPTYDELPHLTAGMAYWLYNDYRLQPENGNLPQRWAAAAALLGNSVQFPPLDNSFWEHSDLWHLSGMLMYRSNNNPDRLLLFGRGAIAVLSAAVCLVVFFWSRGLWGPAGSWVSFLACAFCPSLLAHGHLITSDACAALFFTAAVVLIWRNLQRVTPACTALGALAVAGLFLSKFSAPLVIPMALLMVAARLIVRTPLPVELGALGRRAVAGLWSQAGVLLALAATYTLVSWLLVWTAYGWRYHVAGSGPAPDLGDFGTLEKATAQLGGTGRVIQALGDRRLLPEAYLYGYAHVLATEKRQAFWNGDYSITGWRGYFPYCWLVKTPLPTIGLVVLAAAAGVAWCRRRRSWSDPAVRELLASAAVPAFALLAVYWPAAVRSTLNIGHRHILPTYPATYVLAGGVTLLPALRRVRLLTWGLVAWVVVEAVVSFPNYIAYCNEALGTRNGYRHLVDSSLDWGQDLPQLKVWLDRHADAHAPGAPVYLAYFGPAPPPHYHIEAINFRAHSFPVGRYRPGLYCVSATSLQGAYGDMAEPPGRWGRLYEQAYQEDRRTIDRFAGEDLEKAAARAPGLREVVEEFNRLQAGRILAYLRQREPLDNVGGSILIFDLPEAALKEALDGPPPGRPEVPADRFPSAEFQ